jgi:hypothetical protein
MASARGPLLLYVLPLLSVLVLGVSLFLGTEGAAVRSAVVLGGPTDSEGPFRGRLQVVEEEQGATQPLANAQVLLRAEQASHVVERRLVTDPTGWVEFELPLHPRAPFEITVFDARGNTLARGQPILEMARWRRAARVRPGDLGTHEKGAFRAKITIERGVFAVPFEGGGAVTVLEDGRPLSGAPIKLTASGARLLSSAHGVTDREGRFTFLVAPEQHVSALRFVVFEAEQEWEFEQVLPVVPGAYGLSEDQAGLIIQAPVPREEAWFTFVTESERLMGGRVDLREDARGIYSAKVPFASIPKVRGLYVVLASSADGRSPSTVGYPLDGQTQTLDLWDGYLLDGGPFARSRAELKRRKVRLTLGAYAGLSGLLTLVLFVLRIRSADRALQAQLKSVGATSETRDKSQAPLLIAVLGLFFAFSAGVLWIVAR